MRRAGRREKPRTRPPRRSQLATEPWGRAAKGGEAGAGPLGKEGKRETGWNLIARESANPALAQARDPQGRLVAADLEMLALELLGSPDDPPFPAIRKRLTERLNDYSRSALGSD